MIHFHSLQVKKVVKETEDTVSLTFDVPPELTDTFRFRQGQNLTIRKKFGEAEARRNYSICTSPADGELKVAVKKVEGGLFSTWANEELQAGAFLDVMPPSGTFYTELYPTQQKNYVAFAAGSGITPILSIIKTTLETEPRSTFTLVYGNRTKSNILFREELEALKDKFLTRFRLYHILSREKTDVPLFSGRIDEEKCRLFFDRIIHLPNCHDFFLCGPEEMIFTVKRALEERGIRREQIHLELFNVPVRKKTAVPSERSSTDGPSALVSVKVDGILFDFPLPYGSKNILDAALDKGADLPYACKGGVCTTCKARLIEGEVAMEVNWGLEPDEIAKGFILTCQSHPKSEKVVVDFDVK